MKINCLTIRPTIVIVGAVFKDFAMRQIAFLVIALISTSCSSLNPSPWVKVKDTRFNVEVMTTHEQRNRGLMFRDSLPEDQGMLFVHANEAPMAYWMKNTKIPLDILYFDENKKLVSAQENVPPCSGGDKCPPYPSESDAKYVLELNAGSMAKYKIQKGDVLIMDESIPATGEP
jgi:uncharacterized protein